MEPYSFHLDQWLPLFPLHDPPGQCREGFTVTGPGDIAMIEQIRTRAAEAVDLGETVPADIHVFALGEPDRRDATKVGGLPYRLRGKPWPRTSAGRPMTFLAQFRYCESVDIIGQLPGDLMLVFVSDRHFRSDGEVLFEWYPLGITELTDRKELPQPDWEFVTCYGFRHRTVDFVEPIPFELLERIIPKEVLSTCSIEVASALISRLMGMKIGGLPTSVFWAWDREKPDLPGRFLGSLASIGPMCCQPYPWLNREKPIPLSRILCQPHLDIYDGFVMHFSLCDDGSVDWLFDAR